MFMKFKVKTGGIHDKHVFVNMDRVERIQPSTTSGESVLIFPRDSRMAAEEGIVIHVLEPFEELCQRYLNERYWEEAK